MRTALRTGVPLDLWWYTLDMPTSLPRHQITETPQIAHAIDLAASRWPGESRSSLLRRLIQAGGSTIEEEADDVALARRAAVEASSGAFPGAFGADYLVELRKDWPA